MTKRSAALLDAIERDEAKELDEAKARYVGYVIQFADDATKSINVKALREDLRLLGLSANALKFDAHGLADLRREVAEHAADLADGDLDEMAQEARAAAKAKATEAWERVQKLKRELAQAELEANAAASQIHAVSPTISARRKAREQRQRRIYDLRDRLTAHGFDPAELPALPSAEPVEMVNARVLERCVVRNTLREPGDLLRVRRRELGHCLAEVGSEQDVMPAKSEYGRDRKPEWSTEGHLQKNGIIVPLRTEQQ